MSLEGLNLDQVETWGCLDWSQIVQILRRLDEEVRLLTVRMELQEEQLQRMRQQIDGLKADRRDGPRTWA